MGAIQNSFNQLLATTSGGLGLASHVKEQKETKRLSATNLARDYIANFGKFTEKVSDFKKQKNELELEGKNIQENYDKDMAEINATYGENIDRLTARQRISRNAEIQRVEATKRLKENLLSMKEKEYNEDRNRLLVTSANLLKDERKLVDERLKKNGLGTLNDLAKERGGK